ncbi:hypothetical protein DEIGR_100347 [Deinococcus grandis]|uniref:PRTase-CE domain-containing protein n=1 Tax=Deinococcus grandis TaxID=57498 RepID=A0A100HGN4_9DEIO|nr:hypothetical protein [Deinococcus grandis]BBN96198.1 hypothetical protein DEGR_29310 [Deinococcus grandis]GAQ20320.1 hypothetical protein DEIGR_100347 [Deinococcus grandis]
MTLLQTDDTAFMDRTLDEMVDLCYENLRTKIEALFQMGEYDWRKFNYTAFIDNFEDSGEKLVAIYLVNSIVYMSEIFCEASLLQKVNSLVSNAAFSDAVKFIPISGGGEVTVDSGFRFTSLVRKSSKYKDDKYFPSLEGLIRSCKNGEMLEIIFVDDIMSTGQQFDALMKKEFIICGQNTSLFDLWRSRRAKIAYIPIVATEYSLERFEEYGSIIYPCFTIDHEYNLLTNIPKYFPQWLTNTINVFEAINSMNKKLNKSGLGIAGQGELALTLAFFNSTPDSTLPLLWSKDESEIHLLRRHA